MLTFIVHRLALAVLTMWAISVLSFVIIQLPPGDFVDAYIARLSAQGSVGVGRGGAGACASSTASISPYVVQYCKWMGRVADAATSACRWSGSGRSPR